MWFALQLPLPYFLANRALWQAGFGFLFLTIVMMWIWFAFIRPPVFGRLNARKYSQTLFAYILRGSDSELPIVAAELARSANALISHCPDIETLHRAPAAAERGSTAALYANDLLLLIANRKFCRAIISEAPGTAMAFFDAMIKQKKYRITIGQFSSNITTEALENRDSVLYHEEAGYHSGLFGYIKPFSTSIYGNCELVEDLASVGNSPLEVSHESRWTWASGQFSAYGRIILITLENYLTENHWGRHSYALFRAFNDISDASRDVHKLDGDEAGFYSSDIYRKLDALVDFIRDAIAVLDKQGVAYQTTLRLRDKDLFHQPDPYDSLADLMFETIFDVSSVKHPASTCWTIHHNTVWSVFFRSNSGKSTKIVQFKLRRLIYDEIRRLEGYPNYKSAKILSLCLNVLGFSPGQKNDYGQPEYALRKVLFKWTKKNYLKIKNRQFEVAAACISGGITFDEDNNRLVKTYLKSLDLEAAKEYLNLDRHDVA